SPPMNLIPVDTLPGNSALGALPAETDIVGIRPDALFLDPQGDNAIAVKGSVELLEPIGGESHLHVRLDSSGQSVVLSVPGRPHTDEGAAVTLHASLADIHPFNTQTGRRTDGAVANL